ncbi:hypothetical protein GQ43DRAFT_469204 [Delitschia confertaspora ATCC 74209]|uniref:Uncharacterized protein n=1 Tax=Delitschia confertaspora ATCC 74209 TaxID=1513339 RepID=A0A9P4JS40_9PLEO|nr:hypothetical protein GQ43DRAFT_469204 [Delitschia confertaspora ATCC 74209]
MANIPQLLLPAICFTGRTLVTCLFLTREWITYGVRPKAVRVSTLPSAAYRDTYLLQLLYQIAPPLMAASVLIHWLNSLSIFRAIIENCVYPENPSVDRPGSGYMTTSWIFPHTVLRRCHQMRHNWMDVCRVPCKALNEDESAARGKVICQQAELRDLPDALKGNIEG